MLTRAWSRYWVHLSARGVSHGFGVASCILPEPGPTVLGKAARKKEKKRLWGFLFCNWGLQILYPIVWRYPTPRQVIFPPLSTRVLIFCFIWVVCCVSRAKIVRAGWKRREEAGPKIGEATKRSNTTLKGNFSTKTTIINMDMDMDIDASQQAIYSHHIFQQHQTLSSAPSWHGIRHIIHPPSAWSHTYQNPRHLGVSRDFLLQKQKQTNDHWPWEAMNMIESNIHSKWSGYYQRKKRVNGIFSVAGWFNPLSPGILLASCSILFISFFRALLVMGRVTGFRSSSEHGAAQCLSLYNYHTPQLISLAIIFLSFFIILLFWLWFFFLLFSWDTWRNLDAR